MVNHKATRKMEKLSKYAKQKENIELANNSKFAIRLEIAMYVFIVIGGFLMLISVKQ